MKNWIRATHNFCNETREWIYRGDRGQDKHELWNSDEVRSKLETKMFKYSLGVHALRRDQWMSLDWIVDETIKAYLGGADDRPMEFEKFIQNTPDYIQIIKSDVLKQLKYLVSIGMVEEREM